MQKHSISIVATLMAAGLGACSASPGDALRVGTGAVDHFLCAQTFFAGGDPDRIYAETLQPIPGYWALDWGVHYTVDRKHREVTATFLGGFESRAVYRDRVGCTIVRGDAPLASLTPADLAVPAAAPLLAPIAGPAVVEPSDPRLKAALDHEFADPATHTEAVVVVHDSRIIAERYAPGFGVDTPIKSNSLTKSVTNALIGILVRQGRLAVDKPAPVAAWAGAGDPRHAITLDQLLRMQSGLAFGGSVQAGLSSLWDPSNRMLFLERDMAGFAESVPLEFKAGEHWNYSDANYLIVSRIIRDAVGGGMGQTYRFIHKELFEPLGMAHSVIEFDATGTPVGAQSMLASARDWARFGQLYLDDGVVGGQRILPEGWVAYSAKPTPDAWIGYGAGFWTNRDHSYGAERRVSLGMPRDAFLGRGKFGQFVIVVPSAKLVVVRLGVAHGDEDTAGVSRLSAEAVAAVGQETSER